MRDSSWDECLENNNVRRITPDVKRADSLREIAKERMRLFEEVNEKNCNFVLEDCYTSLLEIIQSLAFEKGYNILNHLCLGYFLRDFLKRDELFRIFDDLRYKRNSLTYYGNKLDFEVSKQAIKDCKRVIREVKKEV